MKAGNTNNKSTAGRGRRIWAWVLGILLVIGCLFPAPAARSDGEGEPALFGILIQSSREAAAEGEWKKTLTGTFAEVLLKGSHTGESEPAAAAAVVPAPEGLTVLEAWTAEGLAEGAELEADIRMIRLPELLEGQKVSVYEVKDRSLAEPVLAEVSVGSTGTLRLKNGGPQGLAVVLDNRQLQAENSMELDGPGEEIGPEEEPAVESAAMEIRMSADPLEGAAVGDVITYGVFVINTGHIALREGILEANHATLGRKNFALEPGESAEVLFKYLVTQEDVDAGRIVSVVTGNASSEKGADPAEAVATAVVSTVKAEPGLRVSKSADNETAAAGDLLTYTILVENTGNVTLHDIQVTDPMIQTEQLPASFALAPGRSEAFTFTYRVAPEDAAAGKIHNRVSAEGTDPAGTVLSTEAVSEVSVESPEAVLTVLKTVEAEENPGAGALLTCRTLVRNAGTVEIRDIHLADDRVVPEGGEEGFALAPGGEKEFVSTDTVRQADVDAGVIISTATARGTDPAGRPVSKSGTVLVPLVKAAPKLGVAVQASPSREVESGGTITYVAVVRNQGNVTLRNGRIASDHADLSGESFELAPGEEATFLYTYTVNQFDVNRGSVTDVFRAAAAAAHGADPAEAEALTTSLTRRNGHLSVTLTESTAPRDEDGYVMGEVLSCEATVTNDGNLTLTDIDVFFELGQQMFTAESLAPGESAVFTSSYTVSAADIRTGLVAERVSASGRSPVPALPEVTAVSNTVEAETLNPSLTLTLVKKWEDGEDRDRIRPDSVNMTLLMNQDTEVATISLDAENGWTTMIADLPKRYNGVRATYSWREEPVEGYTAEMEVVGNTTTFTNTHAPEEITLSVSKEWEDGSTSARPASLSLALVSDEETRMVTLSPSGDWKAEINVPRYAGGKELEYTWIEPAVAGYTQTDLRTWGNETVITNTRQAGDSGREEAGNTESGGSEETAPEYTLTIYYRYMDGTTASETYRGTVARGGSYSVASPEIEGYSPSMAVVSGYQPGENQEVVILYLPGEDQVVIEDHKTPLGLGHSYTNTGDCIE